MTRISDIQMSRSLVHNILSSREDVNRFGQEISTGYKVAEPGDSNVAGTVAQFRETVQRIEGYGQRISTVQGLLTFQDDTLSSANNVLVRAKEIAAQAANETNGVTERQQMAAEVWALRDQLVSLANSKYQGRYVYGGADDDDPPYDAASYTNPSTGSANQRYYFDNESGTALTRTVKITDDIEITVNTPGNAVFDEGIQALERLGRALEGFDTLPTSGAPSGAGNAFTFPQDYSLQTDAIQNAITLIDTARETDIMPERVTLGGKLKRLETAQSLLELSKVSAQEVLSRLQDADLATSGSNLSLAQTALQASLTVTSRVLNLSILDYI